jgi:hypothetical protein
MERWSVRFVVFERDGEFEAECLDAAAAGTGKSPFAAMDDLVQMLNTMAVLAHESGSSLLAEADPDDDELFTRLSAGESHDAVVAFGHLTLTLETRDRTNRARLEKMDLVGGPA